MACQNPKEASADSHDPQDYNVFIVGYKGHGKSATMMNITRDVDYKGPAESGIEKRTHEKCTFYDTPGFGSLDTTDSHVLRVINEKAHAVGEVHAVLFVVRYWRIKSSLISLIQQLNDVFGPNYHRRTIIVFTFTNHEVDNTLRDYLEDSPLEFKEFVEMCENRKIMLDNSNLQTGNTAASEIEDMIAKMRSEPLIVPWSRVSSIASLKSVAYVPVV
ncbi:GTPase IMAP family member 6-like [Lingula anatina]|uniref:GTPase IMAP family member 6-like n=1 Tax=Lingula anatina TaxID=7574 RepID=A0A1S3I329_LINAN|nr:GTPase IMAP family member 6-like [Lingula anatina]|eukprot:XP_013392675.1 GTPase IMAP family member 6-like [Lingula anatina]